MAQRYLMYIEYDGTPFVGWQKQKEGLAVQEALETAVKMYSGETVRIQGCGRTDAGVHAIAMPAHVDIETPTDPYRLTAALNACLRPHSIAILKAVPVDDSVHARFSCYERLYTYRLINRRSIATFDRNKVWVVHPDLNTDLMKLAAQKLIGKHDFSTFRAAACQAKSPIKKLDELRLVVEDLPFAGKSITFHLRAQSFLHNQVRAMVGSLVKVGRGQWSLDDFQAAMDAKDRTRGGQNAPPHGLYFTAGHFAGFDLDLKNLDVSDPRT